MEEIGKMFFFDGLRDVDIVFYQNASTWPFGSDTAACARTNPASGKQETLFNWPHLQWTSIPLHDRPRQFMSTLLHECVHVYFLRYAHPDAKKGTSGHHVGWHIVAEAVERHSSDTFGVKIDLHRFIALAGECLDWNSIHLNQQQLKICFADYISYTETGTLDLFGVRLFGLWNSKRTKYVRANKAITTGD